jgi:hypothetical protein
MDARALGSAHALAPVVAVKLRAHRTYEELRRALDKAGAPVGGAYGSKP